MTQILVNTVPAARQVLCVEFSSTPFSVGGFENPGLASEEGLNFDFAPVSETFLTLIFGRAATAAQLSLSSRQWRAIRATRENATCLALTLGEEEPTTPLIAPPELYSGALSIRACCLNGGVPALDIRSMDGDDLQEAFVAVFQATSLIYQDFKPQDGSLFTKLGAMGHVLSSIYEESVARKIRGLRDEAPMIRYNPLALRRLVEDPHTTGYLPNLNALLDDTLESDSAVHRWYQRLRREFFVTAYHLNTSYVGRTLGHLDPCLQKRPPLPIGTLQWMRHAKDMTLAGLRIIEDPKLGTDVSLLKTWARLSSIATKELMVRLGQSQKESILFDPANMLTQTVTVPHASVHPFKVAGASLFMGQTGFLNFLRWTLVALFRGSLFNRAK